MDKDKQKSTSLSSTEAIVSPPDLCICCNEKEVTWPRVCIDCQDTEAQEELFETYCFEGEAGWEEDEMTGEMVKWCSMYCRTCGMIYDGGMRCTYCGDIDPTDTGEFDDDY